VTVFRQTGGHPGLVRASLDVINKKYKLMTAEEAINISPQFLLVSSSYVRYVSELRAFAGLKELPSKPKVRTIRMANESCH
jgi:hypothetical protein